MPLEGPSLPKHRHDHDHHHSSVTRPALPCPALQHALSWRKRRTYLALLLTQRNGEPVPEGEEGEAELAFPNLVPSPAVLRPVLEELEPLIADKDAAGKGKAAKSEPKKRK